MASGEGQVVVVHQEADGVTADAATEAVVKAFLGIDAEDGVFSS